MNRYPDSPILCIFSIVLNAKVNILCDFGPPEYDGNQLVDLRTIVGIEDHDPASYQLGIFWVRPADVHSSCQESPLLNRIGGEAPQAHLPSRIAILGRGMAVKDH